MSIIRISGVMPPELEIYTALKENQLARFYEPEPGLFIAESPQVIRMAMEAGYEPESFLLEEGREDCILEELRFKNYVNPSSGLANIPGDLQVHGTIKNYVNLKEGQNLTSRIQSKNSYVNKNNTDLPVYLAPHGELIKLAGYELTGGALAAFRRQPLPEPEVILKGARRAVALECVMNPRNIGSVFRSAAALGFDAVLLTKGCGDPLYRRAARVSMGTVFQIPWTFADDVSPLRENGFVTVAMALTDNSVSMGDVALKGHEKLAVLMGSERTGLREETIKNADYIAKIPMKHGVDSLNVAAASAVAFWELR